MTFYDKYSKYKTKYKELITLVQEGGEDLKRVFNLNIIKTLPSMTYLKSTFTPNYKGNPLSDHGALKYQNIVVWNITQKGHRINFQNREGAKSTDTQTNSEDKSTDTQTNSEDKSTDTQTNSEDKSTDTQTNSEDNTSFQRAFYTHKFMNIKNESEEQYKRRCFKIKHKIYDIISKNPDIDVFLLQELPSNLRGDIFHKNMRLEIGKNIYVLLCNYDMVSWPNGIMYNSTKYNAKQVFPPEGSSNEEYNRLAIFVLTEHGKKNAIVYISVHFSYKKDPNRDQELVKLIDELIKNLIRTLPHNISEVIIGGDFNTGFKSGLFSEFKDVKLFTLPHFEVYSTHDNFGKRNEYNVDYLIVYKLF
jgi:hypothetical protein